jgi:hypothetical protein
VCPERLENLDWLTGDDPLFIAARDLSRDLLKKDTEPNTTNEKPTKEIVLAKARRP